MRMMDQQTQQQISDLVNACGGYWELRGIQQEKRKEMQLELEQHLEQAVRDGKSLEVVVGSNTLVFAESWAREMPHKPSRGYPIILRWLLFDWLVYALLFLSFIAIFEHVVLRSSSFPFAFAHFLALVFLGLFALLWVLADFFSPQVSRRENRQTLTAGIYIVICLLLLLVLYVAKAPLNVVLFRWEWPFALLLTFGAVGLFGFKYWHTKNTR